MPDLINVNAYEYAGFFAGLRTHGVPFRVTSHDSVNGTGSNDSTFVDGKLIAQRTVTYAKDGNLISMRIAYDWAKQLLLMRTLGATEAK